MDDLQHRLLVSQWIAEEFAGIIDEDHRAKLEAWRKESAGNEQEYQELLQEFRPGDILEPYPEEEIGRQWKKFSKRIYNQLLLNILRVISQKYGHNL